MDRCSVWGFLKHERTDTEIPCWHELHSVLDKLLSVLARFFPCWHDLHSVLARYFSVLTRFVF